MFTCCRQLLCVLSAHTFSIRCVSPLFGEKTHAHTRLTHTHFTLHYSIFLRSTFISIFHFFSFTFLIVRQHLCDKPYYTDLSVLISDVLMYFFQMVVPNQYQYFNFLYILYIYQFIITFTHLTQCSLFYFIYFSVNDFVFFSFYLSLSCSPNLTTFQSINQWLLLRSLFAPKSVITVIFIVEFIKWLLRFTFPLSGCSEVCLKC